MINVARISHTTFDTPDVERQVDYLVNILGLSVLDRHEGAAFLGTTMGQQILTVNKADRAECKAISFQTDPNVPLQDVARGLSALGIEAVSASDPMPGIGETLSFKDPKGTTIELYNDWALQTPTREPKGFLPLKLGHLAFSVGDIHQVVNFYRDVLGMRISDWRQDIFVFMRCGPEHHNINFAVGEKTQMHHVAYEVKDWSEMLRACDWLASNKYQLIWGPGRHVIGDNIFTYHRDPDGNVIELYCEMAKIDDDRLDMFATRPWREALPYRPGVWDLKTMGNFWGPSKHESFVQ